MEIRTEIEINAPAEVVWDILTDPEGYPDWNPFTYRVQGDFRLGGRIRLNVRFADNSEVESGYEISTWDAPRQICWQRTNIPLLLWSKRYQFIEPLGEGRVKYINREMIFGPLAFLVAWTYSKRIREGLLACSEGLRKKAEK